MNITELSDRVALKELIDMVSILGDKKDVHAQVQLFTENALSETFVEGSLFLQLQGRTAMEEAIGNFLKPFDTVYHFNGQQQVMINGDHATGTSYCLVTLIGFEKGKKVKTTIGVIYHDDFVRENNRWLIAKRIGNFEWQEKREISIGYLEPHSKLSPM
jgi:hypothetical protein